ncbi:MAG: GPW/gp25 family protein [Pseudomonadota bacterium]|nr:GPW/gp25 family protein [Pseudomonadota bacterium]MEE2748880.1 GPW/gp25 family protein [Pseudomonadota bacterium]
MPGMNASTGELLTEREHILQSLRTIVLTPVGTRIQRRDFGSVIPGLIDQPLNTATMLRLYSATAAAIIKWEPRVTLVSISLSSDNGAVVLDLVVSINDEEINARIGLEAAA